MKLKIIVKNILGLIIIGFSFLMFASGFQLLTQGDYVTTIVALSCSMLIFAVGLAIRTPLEELRQKILVLMKRHLPTCPLCKSDSGYTVTGWWPWNQKITCKNCETEWHTNFSLSKGLRSLTLNKIPDPEIYADFVSQSSLKIQRRYPIEYWVSPPLSLQSRWQLEIEVSHWIKDHKKASFLAVGCVICVLVGFKLLTTNIVLSCISFALTFSIVIALFGFFIFGFDEKKAYELFIFALIGIIGLFFAFYYQ